MELFSLLINCYIGLNDEEEGKRILWAQRQLTRMYNIKSTINSYIVVMNNAGIISKKKKLTKKWY